MPRVCCTACSQPYPDSGLPHVCPACGGVYDFDGPFAFHFNEVEDHLPGIWRYRHSYALPPDAPVVSLGEGGTPLIPVDAFGQKVWLKVDGLNPTGSYKDRGSAVLVSMLRQRGAMQAVEDSSGNAGASFAAYAARADLKARVFVPTAASGPKRSQIEAYGADLVPVPGPRSAAAEAVLADVRQGAVYASHAYLPFGLAGIASLAYEIQEQMRGSPGTVIAPVGHGGLLLGVVRGFTALQRAGIIQKVPYCVGVQARACAPVWAEFSAGISAMQQIEEGPTVAEGVRVRQPVRAKALLSELAGGAGTLLAIAEDEILPAYHSLARRGIHVEPTSALAWCALEQLAGKLPEPVVLILSGTGLKYRASI